MVASPLFPVWRPLVGHQLGRFCSFPPRVHAAALSQRLIETSSLRPMIACNRFFATSRRQCGGGCGGAGISPRSGERQQLSTRLFSTSSAWGAKPKTVQQLKARNATGPFSWKAALLFIVTGAVMVTYFRCEKARLERHQIAELNKGAGRPKVGGPFRLRDTEGKVFTEEDLKGKYAFVYFGFTHCPDICPDELDKMANIIDRVKARFGGQSVMRPVFITCDPARDTPQVVKNYLAEFHPDIIGLTGTYQQVKNVCKAYRVYFSTPENVTEDEDYLVDHSIYFYLMDPEGDFVECVGRQDTPESAANLISSHINDWKGAGKPLDA